MAGHDEPLGAPGAELRTEHAAVAYGVPSMNRRLAREVAALAWPAILQGLVTTVIFFTDRLAGNLDVVPRPC